MDSTILKSLNVNGRLPDLSTPQVMGILGVTPDSLYAGSRSQAEAEIAARACQILDEGTSITGIGVYSSRFNVKRISPEGEMWRLRTELGILNRGHPNVIISMDIFHTEVAQQCVEKYGAAIINDISADEMDEQMFLTVARLSVPYIMMHIQGIPQSMQKEPHCEDLLREVFTYFAWKIR